jgi:divalent metal cation (Fe/Co/Zn/Cd) transporter
MASSIFHCIIACCVMMVGGSLFLGLIDPLLANWGGSVLGQLVRVGTGIGAAGACYLLTHVLIRFLKRVIHK